MIHVFTKEDEFNIEQVSCTSDQTNGQSNVVNNPYVQQYGLTYVIGPHH